MDVNLNDKLARELPLGVDESLWLDEALERQAVVGRLVSSLPESDPSLAWRSRLNARLRESSVKKRRKLTLGWFAGSLATACAVVATVMLLPKEPSIVAPAASAHGKAPAAGVEESLLSAHREADLESAMGVSWTQSPSESKTGSL